MLTCLMQRRFQGIGGGVEGWEGGGTCIWFNLHVLICKCGADFPEKHVRRQPPTWQATRNQKTSWLGQSMSREPERSSSTCCSDGPCVTSGGQKVPREEPSVSGCTPGYPYSQREGHELQPCQELHQDRNTQFLIYVVVKRSNDLGYWTCTLPVF